MKALDGTCEWFFQSSEYKLWRDNENATKENGFLWIKGKPGAGKSTLMKMILDNVRTHDVGKKPVITRFFFNARGSSCLETTMLGLFRSLTCQLLQRCRGLFRKILPIYRRKIDAHGNGWDWHVQELKDCVYDMYVEGNTGPIYVIIDALDECGELESKDTVMFWQDFLSSSIETAPVRICLSGRYYPIIDVDDCLEMHLDKFNKSDI